MDIQFVYGKIDLGKLQDIDAIICPTDNHCSGSGGLDLAIHQAAGPELHSALKEKQLADAEVFVTDGFLLNTKRIVHAAIPKATPANIQSNALRSVYKNILWVIGGPHTPTPCKTAAITLLGTGFCGWSFDQSMAALWSVILEYHRDHGSAYFGKGQLEKLLIYYPTDASKTVFSYYNRTSQAFFHAPDQWGLRGDPRLWYALMEHFDDPQFNTIKPPAFIKEIQRFFHNLTGKWLCADTQIYVQQWDHGGMGGGGIGSFMAEIGIPILCSNLCKLQKKSHDLSFMIPVTLAQYPLSLPYDLLPQLMILRKKQYELLVQTKLCLAAGQPYFLTVSHYPEAPELIDHYSLDVETANDSHYSFSKESAIHLCEQLGYAPHALIAALSAYLQSHGGFGLEMLIQKIADKEFHF